MGLCKCPKRKVTNLFCYEHRVNVCPHCMVTLHPKCIVQSYILWLQDSDYDRTCVLCTKELSTDDCVRLLCYHVFHWHCLDRYSRQLPNTTAPAGYTCPTCTEPIFPKLNVVSPVAVALREKLATVNWARVCLGLPLLSEDGEPKAPSDGLNMTPVVHNGSSSSIDKHSFSSAKKSDIVVQMDSSYMSDMQVQMPRRTFHGMDTAKHDVLDDDENKYRRRLPSYWVQRWTKFFWNTIRLQRGPKRYCIMIFLAVIILTFICLIFSTLGRIVTADDPSLNINQNPHIHTNIAK